MNGLAGKETLPGRQTPIYKDRGAEEVRNRETSIRELKERILSQEKGQEDFMKGGHSQTDTWASPKAALCAQAKLEKREKGGGNRSQ